MQSVEAYKYSRILDNAGHSLRLPRWRSINKETVGPTKSTIKAPATVVHDPEDVLGTIRNENIAPKTQPAEDESTEIRRSRRLRALQRIKTIHTQLFRKKPAPPSPFLALPREIRNNIYYQLIDEAILVVYVSEPSSRTGIRDIRLRRNRVGVPLALLLTCKQISDECPAEVFRHLCVCLLGSFPQRTLREMHETSYHPLISQPSCEAILRRARRASLHFILKTTRTWDQCIRDNDWAFRLLRLCPDLRRLILTADFSADRMYWGDTVDEAKRVDLSRTFYSKVVELVPKRPDRVLGPMLPEKEIDWSLLMDWGPDVPAHNDLHVPGEEDLSNLLLFTSKARMVELKSGRVKTTELEMHLLVDSMPPPKHLLTLKKTRVATTSSNVNFHDGYRGPDNVFKAAKRSGKSFVKGWWYKP